MVQFLRCTSLLIVIQMIALIIAAPQGGQKDDDEMAVILVMVGCWAENWGDDAKQEACRNCFFAADMDTEAGLTESKQCMNNYLPKEAEACQDELSQLTLANSESQGKVVLKCMGETLKTMGQDYCISVAGSRDVVDQLTKSSMCMIHSHFETMEHIKEIAGDKMEGMEHGEQIKMKMWSLLTKAHCDLASNGNAGQTTSCSDCFTSAYSSPKDQIVSGIVKCSKSHLGDLYSKCTKLVESGDENAKQCYASVLVRNLVEDCTDDSSVVDRDTLEDVMKCGKNAAITWVYKNAKSGLANKIAAMLHSEDSDE